MNFDNWTSDAWLTFAQDHWVVIVVAVVAIFIVVNVVKTVVKWGLIAAIVVGIVVYGGYSVDDLKAVGADLTSKVSAELKDQAINAMAGEAKEATYTDNGDGTYTVKSSKLELTGKPGSGEVSVSFNGSTLGTWQLEGAVKQFVEQARKSAK
ncbi:hypothetical protein ACFPVX_16535 [Cohnella faecalis]|uniref:Uncharacterized protein n=1 Tax=Cohnella faecalis TaxID=2315694 RepID=A0A398CSI2_9BACL|nr:hypothetical protein [Cohnella faecalis]RIE02757.1 hypothetical protein D3H35_19130 [Cohnella faecalis]